MQTTLWAKAFERSVRMGKRVVDKAINESVDRHRPPPGDGDWIAGMAIGLRHGAFQHVGYQCYAWPAHLNAIGFNSSVAGNVVAAIVGNTW